MDSEKVEYPDVWSFKDEFVVQHFDEHVKASIPMYDEIQRMISEIAQFFVRENDLIIDLGSSTGKTITSIDNALGKDYDVIGVDNSEEMLEYCRKNVHLVGSTTWMLHDLNDSLTEKIKSTDNVSLIVSLYTLQFIKLENRQRLIKECYEFLRKDGAIFIVEKIEGTNARFNEMMTEFYNDMKVRNGLDPADNVKKTRSLRGVMCPITLEDNIKLLEQSGFKKIEVVFKWYNFAGILAIK